MRGMKTPSLASLYARLPRMCGWLAIAVVLGCAVAVLAPQQLAVSLYKLSLVSMAAVAGYWLDRSLFPYARPDAYEKLSFSRGDPMQQVTLFVFVGCMLRRAVVVAAAMLAVGMGA